jgi:cytoskeletal protein CcmA (bactofilin family)
MNKMKNRDIIITTIIGRGAECEGDFTSQGSARVDGRVIGNVNVKETLIVGAEGYINGDISASAVIIGGEVEGNVSAPGRVELTSSAKVIGDITTTTIVIDEKAIFQGGCNMNQEASSKRPKPARRAVKEGRKSAKAAIAEALKEVEAENNRESSEAEDVKEDAVVKEDPVVKEETAVTEESSAKEENAEKTEGGSL